MNGAAHELVIGLVTPIGTDSSDIQAELTRVLQVSCNYNVQIIKASELIGRYCGSWAPLSEYEDERIRRLIDAGNRLCRSHENPAAVAQLAVALIRDTRASLADSFSPNGARCAFIINTLKRPAEVELLRQIYGPQFVLFAMQVPEEDRLDNLASGYLSVHDHSERRKLAQDLMDLDGNEKSEEYGQCVNKTYGEADFFLSSPCEVERCVKLLWGDPSVAPEPAEVAMYAAHAASACSRAASRRVGAALVIADRVVSTGFNDVPPGEMPDVIQSVDASEKYKSEMLLEALDILQRNIGFDREHIEGTNLKNLTAALDDSRLLSVIEGQRAVHAEAAAIDDAARRGVAIIDATLFTTTFPCHLCFKAVLDVEISTVRYIYPYPKSRAREMFREGATRLAPYTGVSPRMYMRVFLDRPIPLADENNHLELPDLAVDSPFFPNRTTVPPETVEKQEVAVVTEFGEKEEDLNRECQ